jgi:hypothetical protein
VALIRDCDCMSFLCVCVSAVFISYYHHKHPRYDHKKILNKEVIIFEKDYLSLKATLLRVEEELRHKTLYDIQAWWATRLAIRRARKMYQRMEHSLYYRRIRRLVLMKRAVDKFHSWLSSLKDLELLYDDVLPELSEYRLYKTKKVQSIVIRFAKRILDISNSKRVDMDIRVRL